MAGAGFYFSQKTRKAQSLLSTLLCHVSHVLHEFGKLKLRINFLAESAENAEIGES